MELLIEHLKQMGSEYAISLSSGVSYMSDKYDRLIVSKPVATDMYCLDNMYYHKKSSKVELDGVVYEIVVFVDVTRYANEIMKSKIDCLTRLPNRAQIEEHLSKLKDKCVIVMCDIDDFKKVNDIYGHQTGDDAIRLVGDLIKTIIGEDDFAGRYGGEEFLAVFYTSDIDGVKRKMDELNKFLNKHTSPLNLSASIGIHLYEPGVESIFDVVRKADEALYYIKQNGKNASMMYSDFEKMMNKNTLI